MSARERGPREHLTFSFSSGTVPGLTATGAAVADGDDATLPVARRAVEREKRDWGYLGLVAFTVVLLVRPQDQIPGLDALHLAEVSAIGAVVAMVAHRASRRLPMLRITPEVIGLLVLGAAILASVPFSVWPTGSLTLFLEAYVKVLIVFVLMMNTLTTPKRLREITWVMVVCCTYVAARSLVDYAQGRNLVEGDRLSGAVGGIFGNPNDLAMNLVTFVPAALVAALGRGQPVSRRLIAAASVVCMLAAIIATKSRGGTLGLVAVVLVLMILGRKVRPGFAAAVVFIAVASIPLMPASFTSRMASIVSEQQDREEYTGSREARSTVMLEGIQAFVSYPLTGIGAGQFPNYSPSTRKERWRETHNALIQVAAETGILGLLAFSFLIVRAGMAAAATRRMLAPPRRRGPDIAAAAMSDAERREMLTLGVGLTAGLAGWFVCSLFASVAYNWTFYYLLALVVSARELTRARLDAVRPAAARPTDRTTSGVRASSTPLPWPPPAAERHPRAIPRGTA